MAKKLTQEELLEIKNFTPETAQNINETIEDLLVFVRALFDVFPENEFVLSKRLCTLPGIRTEIERLQPESWINLDKSLDIMSGTLLEISFSLIISKPVRDILFPGIPCNDYLAEVCISLNTSHVVTLSIFREDVSDWLADPVVSLFYESYFKIIKSLIEKVKFTEGCKIYFNPSSEKKSASLKAFLNKKDTLIILKIIHENGFTIANLPN